MPILVTAPVRIDISAGWPDSDPSRKDFGGLVLNAAIDMHVTATFDGYLKTSPEEVPSHSSLGTSGALRAVELVASNPRLLQNKYDLIKKIHVFENQIIEHRAGFQDEAAAVFGGVNLWTFGADDSIQHQPIPKARAQHLEDRLVLMYTGTSHLSSNIHNLVFGPGNYERNIPRFKRMKDIAQEMFSKIENESAMAALIEETWELQRQLHESIETDEMRALQSALKGRYRAARATGAGGGGCMIFYTDDKFELIRKFKETRDSLPKGMAHLPFKFDYEGMKVTYY